MIEIEDRDFFDLLYTQWTKTTGASDTYWMYEEDPDEHIPWQIFAVGEGDKKQWIAELWSEANAEWITGVHGCFGDLVRRMHEALDEADRADQGKDEAIQRIFELEAQVDESDAVIADLQYQLHEVGL